MTINLKTENEIAIMRIAGRKLSEIMLQLEKKVVPNVDTLTLDKLAEELVLKSGGKPAFKGYGEKKNPFPATICASRNNEIVHGIPSAQTILQAGDLFKIDIGMEYKGFFVDMARTFAVGKIDQESEKLIEISKKAFQLGIKKLREGEKLSTFSKAAQKVVEDAGFSVVRDLVGHGIGKNLHEDPQIPNYFEKGFRDLELKAGMTLALEPMINAGTCKTVLGSDGWVFLTADGSRSAHYENTILITKKGVEILTA